MDENDRYGLSPVGEDEAGFGNKVFAPYTGDKNQNAQSAVERKSQAQGVPRIEPKFVFEKNSLRNAGDYGGKRRKTRRNKRTRKTKKCKKKKKSKKSRRRR